MKSRTLLVIIVLAILTVGIGIEIAVVRLRVSHRVLTIASNQRQTCDNGSFANTSGLTWNSSPIVVTTSSNGNVLGAPQLPRDQAVSYPLRINTASINAADITAQSIQLNSNDGTSIILTCKHGRLHWHRVKKQDRPSDIIHY